MILGCYSLACFTKDSKDRVQVLRSSSFKYNFHMKRPVLLHIAASIVLSLSLLFLLWGFNPDSKKIQTIKVPGLGTQILAWTPRIRMGDRGTLRLEFDAEDLFSSGQIKVGENNSTNQISRPLNKGDNLLVHARVESVGLILEPGEELIQPLRAGENLTFVWQIQPLLRREIKGEVWSYLQIVSLGENSQDRYPITIVNFDLESIDLLGMTGQTARMFGIIGICIAFFLWRGQIVRYMPHLAGRSRQNSE